MIVRYKIKPCSNLIGKWELIETFEDPGDGSGVYETIDSEKTIEFFNNGTNYIQY